MVELRNFSSSHSTKVLLAVLLVLSLFAGLGCEAQKLDKDEVNVLKIIAPKVKMNWDFSVDPCSQTNGWVVNATSPDTVGNAINIVSNLTCDCSNTTSSCHVTSIQLKGQNLTGVLPDEFANLTFLTTLDLTRNYLNGTIPIAWASLPLVHLSLMGNRVSGRIPDELGNIISLQNLTLDANQLEGPLPESIGNLTNLVYFGVSGNNLSGQLPESFGKLKNLKTVILDGNPISGKIPSFIANWANLSRLDMQGTLMEGPFPSALSTLKSLQQLRISDLKVGLEEFPPLQDMTSMQRLVLRNLSISAELPSFVPLMSNLKTLDLSYNSLNGSIPSSYSTLSKSINYLYFMNNNLSGSIPDWIQQSDKNIDLSYNSFTGWPAPTACQQGSMSLVSSYPSTFSYSIQPCLRQNFPCSGKAENYNLFINCGGNRVVVDGKVFEDDTTQLGPAQFAQSADNKWAYSSTGDFVDNSNEQYIANNFSILNMTNAELYKTARLSPLSLRYYGLCLQKGEYNVTLHFAEIMFTDNQSFASVGRRIFDVSIQGIKVLHDFNIAKEANGTGRELVLSFNALVSDGTLEIHFQWTGKGTHAIPHASVYGPLISAISVTPNFKPDTGGTKLSVGASVGIAAAAFVIIVLISVLLWIYLRRTKPYDPELRGLELQTGYFSLRHIKAATKNFDPANKIGEGGFGPVFKGVLSDGSAIAVKQLSSKSKQGNREFVNEIGTISGLQHPNLVKLHGCCIEGDQLFLVYEYMENNCLARVLFGSEEHKKRLDWRTRCEICLGIARGLAFLHESRLKIIHRDIKATNILLDKDFKAKISDFGLAKLTEDENTHVSTRIAGTRGYMAPEYATRGYLTHKADVYSFGVVILELVSGMSNTNYQMHEEFVYLLDRAYVLQERGGLLELVDKSLGSNFSKEEALYMLSLALLCTNPSPTLRPTMSSVVEMLESKTPIKVPSTRNIMSTVYLGYNISERSFHDSSPPRISRERVSSSSNAQSRVSVDDDPWIAESYYSSSKEVNSLISSTSKSPQSTKSSFL